MTIPNQITPMPSQPAPEPDSNPFRYGWRFVKHQRPDGTVGVEQVPLTLRDVLHPQEGDVIPENSIHEPERGHLAGACRTRLPRLEDGHVFSDCIIDWNVAGLGNHSPDISIFEHVRGLPLPSLGTYRRAEFGGRCVLAMEIVSPHTRTNDVDTKPEHYHRAGVQQYVIIDQQREDGPRQLIDRRWTMDGYVIEPPDGDGRVRLEALGLLVGLRDNRVVVFDGETGDELHEYAEEHAARLAAEAKARREAVERKRAEEDARREALERKRAEDRIRELEEKLRQRNNPAEGNGKPDGRTS